MKSLTTATKDTQVFSTAGEGKTHAVIKAVRVSEVRAKAQVQLQAVESLEQRLQAPIYQTGDWDFSQHYADAHARVKSAQKQLAAIAHLEDTALFWSVVSWHGSYEAAERKARQAGLGRTPFVVIIEANNG